MSPCRHAPVTTPSPLTLLSPTPLVGSLPHRLTSQYVRDQLSLRGTRVNDKRTQPEGEFILYWMQSTHRLEENWALRFAVLEADRLNKPLVIHQGLDPTYLHAADPRLVPDAPLVTEVEPHSTFYKAEDYHQDYFLNNPRQPYCQAVVAPKVAKARKVFFERLKK